MVGETLVPLTGFEPVSTSLAHSTVELKRLIRRGWGITSPFRRKQQTIVAPSAGALKKEEEKMKPVDELYILSVIKEGGVSSPHPRHFF